MTSSLVFALSLLVSSTWLAENRDRVTVVHVGTPQSFAEEHVPGAHFLDVAKLVVPRTGNRDELPQIDQLQATLEELGIGTRGRIVIYGDEPQYAARLFWTLDYLGQGKRLALLDGGLAQWKRDLRPVASGPPDHKRRPFTARIELERLMLMTKLQTLTNVPIVDARSAAEFEKGHIPNAVNVDWRSTVWRSDDELRKLFTVAPPAHVVVYDETGMEASWLYFVLRHLGYAPALFDGGWEEWGRWGG